jgi:hypothetical protein
MSHILHGENGNYEGFNARKSMADQDRLNFTGFEHERQI